MAQRYSEFEAPDRAMLPLLRTAEDGAAALSALPPKRMFGSGSAAVVRRGTPLTLVALDHAVQVVNWLNRLTAIYRLADRLGDG